MKVFKVIIIFILAVVILLVVGAVVFLKTVDLNKYLPQIVEQASAVLGRSVTIKKADLSLSLRGIALDVKGVTIADDLQFSSTDFASIDTAHLRLDVMALITRREIQVTDIVVKAPHISIIRSVTGAINAQTIAVKPETGHEEKIAEVASPASVVKPAPAPVMPALSIKSIKIVDADILFEDKNPQLPVKIRVTAVNVGVMDFSLDKPFRFIADAVLLGTTSNVKAEGQALLDLPRLGVLVSDMHVQVDLGKIEIAQARSVTPLLSQLPFPNLIKGQLLIAIPKVEVVGGLLNAFNAQVTLNDGVVGLEQLLSPLTAITAQLEIDQKDITLKSLSVAIASGSIMADGYLKDYAKSQAFKVKAEFKGIKVQELIDQKILPAELKGNIEGKVDLGGQGFVPDSLMTSLKGDANIEITEGVIEKMNIVTMSLGNVLSGVPGLAGSIDSMLSGALKDKVGADRTMIDKAVLNLSLGEGALIRLKDALVATKVFDFTAQGDVDYDLNANIQTMLRLSADVSDSAVAEVKELAYLQDNDKRVAIPAKVSGPITSLKYTPTVDLKKVASNALIEEGSKQLQKVIEKNPEIGGILDAVFGGANENDAQLEQDNASQGEEQPADKGEKAKKLINNLLNDILR